MLNVSLFHFLSPSCFFARFARRRENVGRKSSVSAHGLRIRFRTLKTFNVILVGKPVFVNPFCGGRMEIQQIHLFAPCKLGQVAQQFFSVFFPDFFRFFSGINYRQRLR
ncbi:MAG: hypothetical protein PUJ12_01905 [Oscillospiraceae bacterium]|nr:hypothetical protein [Oscillospiraceae bacterium]